MPPSPAAPLPPEEPVQWILVFRPHLDELLAAADDLLNWSDPYEFQEGRSRLRLALEPFQPQPEPATPDIVTPEGWRP